MNREPKPFVKILMSYCLLVLFFLIIFKLTNFECFIVNNVKRAVEMPDWILRCITGAEGRLSEPSAE